MTSPVESAAQGPREHGDGQRSGKPKQQHAQAGAKEPAEQNLLAADLVAEPAPEDAADALHEGKGRRDHADVHGDLAGVVGDVEVLHHVVGVGEDGHEGNGLAYAAEGWQC